MLLESNANISILFTDILMPGEMNGRQLATWAAEKNPLLKILLTSASEKEAQYQPSTELQSFPMLPKPYSKKHLIEKLHDIIQ